MLCVSHAYLLHKACVEGFSCILKVAPSVRAERAPEVTNIINIAAVLWALTKMNRLQTSTGRSANHARCNVSPTATYFRPIYFKSMWNWLLFYKISFLLCKTNAFSLLLLPKLATKSWLPDPGYQIVATRSWVPCPRYQILATRSWLADAGC